MEDLEINEALLNRYGTDLAKRFFQVRQQGNQKYYYDLETGETNLQPMHLIGVLMEWGVETITDAQHVLKHQHLLPIAQKKLYRPKQMPIVKEKQLHYINLWREPEVQPDSTLSAEPFVNHLVRVLGSSEKADYVLDMLAYRYQNPMLEHKPHIAFYFFGSQGGAGKSTFAETLTKVFGRSAVQTTNTVDALSNKGAVDLWSRTLLIVEEAQVSKGTKLYDAIKSYTGSDIVTTDKKFADVSTYEIPAQLIMLSNRTSMFIEEQDRRFFVSQWHLDIDGDRNRAWYFKEYREWLNNGGYEAIAGLLKTRSITVNPFEAAPMTAEKEQAIGAMVDPVVLAIQSFLEDNTQQRLFEERHFESVFHRYKVSKSSMWKYFLGEAGLRRHGRVLIKGKQPTVWLREGDEFVPAKGSLGPRVKTPEGSIYLAADAYEVPDF